MEKRDRNIIDTFSYFDVFNYPLKLQEVKFFLHYDKLNLTILKERLTSISLIGKDRGFFFLKNRKKTALRRKMLERENTRKWQIALRASLLLRFVPGVKLIGISGSAAMGNSSKKDDIDLFIITRKNMLWITRLFSVILMKIVGLKRGYKTRDSQDKICLNMFLDEEDMNLENKKSLYTAHEIAQLKVLFDKDNIFNDFIAQNNWIEVYLPALKKKNRILQGVIDKKRNSLVEALTISTNFAFFLAQFLYMVRRKTNESVTLKRALFHPDDKKEHILNEYRKRKKYYFSLLEGISKANPKLFTGVNYGEDKIPN